MLSSLTRLLTRPSPRRPARRPRIRPTLEPLEERLALSLQQIANTTVYPFSTSVQLDILNHGHGVSMSGAMIDPTHVLTAAHGLYDPALGLADSVTAIAGRNGQNGEPFGAVPATRWAVHAGYVSGPFAGQAAYDLAVVTLDRPLGNTTGYLGVSPLIPDSYFNGGGTLNILEYPGDTHSGVNEFLATGPALNADANEVHWLLQNLPVEHGSSGSPVFVTDASGNRYVTAVVSEFNPTEGIGTRITTPKFNWIVDQVTGTSSGPTSIPAGPSGPGLFDPNTGVWYLRNSTTPGGPDGGVFGYGARGWLPVSGDWNGDGVPTVGVVSPAGTWYLRNSNRPGSPDIQPFTYGSGNWVPVVGDWNGDGATTVGMFDPNTATWYLKNTNTPGAPDIAPFRFGGPGWIPVVGDWDGNGTTTAGVVNPANEVWYLRNSNSGGPPNIAPFAYGAPGWLPVAGDWSGPPPTAGGQQASLTLATDAVFAMSAQGANLPVAPVAASASSPAQGQAADEALLAGAGGTKATPKDPPPVILDSGPVVGGADGLKVQL
jgi:V8-like Glu-specific endopeptidase